MQLYYLRNAKSGLCPEDCNYCSQSKIADTPVNKYVFQDEKTLLDLDFKIKQQELDLEKEYSDKFLKVISPQKLVQLHQAEDDFRRLLIRQIEQRQGRMDRRQRLRDSYQQTPALPEDN